MILYVFSSNFCVPCKKFKKDLEKNNIDFVEKNFDSMTDKDMSWSNQFKIKALPTSIVFDEENLKVENYLPGVIPIEKIKNIMNR